MFTMFFDLDGTLLNSQSGIIQSMQHAFTEVGAIEPSSDELRGMIGSSLPHIFANFLGDRGEIGEAIAAYREHYSQEAMFEAELYDGVEDMFDTLLTSDVNVYVATAEPHVYAQEICAHFGIAQLVTRIFGSEMDGTNTDKSALLQYALDETGYDPARCIMVGDRQQDMFAARNNDIVSMGALWGYGEPEEMRMSEADLMAGHPSEVAEMAFDAMGIDA